VVVASANYAFLALIDISYCALQPVFFSTPVALGGLGVDPPVIGAVAASCGILCGIVAMFFSRMTDYFGMKVVYLLGITAAVPCFSMFPIINYLARNSVERSGELGTEVWVAVGLQTTMLVLFSLCFGTSIPTKLNNLLTDSLIRFSRSAHLHRRRCAQQRSFGSYNWARSSVGICRACGRTRPGEFDLFAVD
jgi:MFS family permease